MIERWLTTHTATRPFVPPHCLDRWENEGGAWRDEHPTASNS
jgi:hypothetical protein